MKVVENSHPLGKLIILIGLLVGMPAAMILFFPEEARYLPAFLLPSFGSFVLGLVVCWRCPTKEANPLEWHSALERGSIPVVFAWLYAIFMGALPFLLGGQLGVLHSLFEAVSGWTTAGFTVADVKALPRIFLFHRSLMQFCGGLGFVILIAMLINGKQTMSHYLAEGHPDRIRPSIKGTAQAIFTWYMSVLGIGSVLFKFFGMDWFEALNHSMTALSTAGFSTAAGGIAAYDSIGIEAVAMVLMLVGSVNFGLLMILFRGKVRQVLLSSEIRLMGALLGGALVVVLLSGVGVRHGLFGLVSALSTTGFATADYLGWPPAAQGVMLVLMVIGGGAGSTAGGLKLLRVYIMLKATKENIRRRVAPARQVRAAYVQQARGKKLMDDKLALDVFAFGACYGALLLVGTMMLSVATGATLSRSFFEFASAFGTAGFSGGLTSASSNVGTLLIQMVAMLLGRLEVLIVFIALYALGNLLKKSLQK